MSSGSRFVGFPTNHDELQKIRSYHLLLRFVQITYKINIIVATSYDNNKKMFAMRSNCGRYLLLFTENSYSRESSNV